MTGTHLPIRDCAKKLGRLVGKHPWLSALGDEGILLMADGAGEAVRAERHWESWEAMAGSGFLTGTHSGCCWWVCLWLAWGWGRMSKGAAGRPGRVSCSVRWRGR